MNATFLKDSIVDGDGVRGVLFVSGCLHKCMECHNKDTWNFKHGKPFDLQMQKEIIDYCENPFVTGLTLSGGDPMYSAKDLLFFIKKFKSKLGIVKDIWIYSGFTYEEILKDSTMFNLLKKCDVLVDGKYDKTKKDLTYIPRGSTNQRIINIQESIFSKSIIILKDTYE